MNKITIRKEDFERMIEKVEYPSEWEELNVHEVLALIENNVPNPSPELRDQLYGLISQTQDLVIEINEEMIQEELEQAVLAEREACAKLVDDWPNGRDDVHSIAKAIRARGIDAAKVGET